MSRPPRLFVRLIGHHHLTTFHHALGGRHLHPTCEHGGLAQYARGDRVPADFGAPVHLLGLMVGPGHLGGQVPFRVHGLQVAHIVVAFPGALHEQPAATRSSVRRRRHLFGGFGEPVHVCMAKRSRLPAARFHAHGGKKKENKKQNETKTLYTIKSPGDLCDSGLYDVNVRRRHGRRSLYTHATRTVHKR